MQAASSNINKRARRRQSHSNVMVVYRTETEELWLTAIWPNNLRNLHTLSDLFSDIFISAKEVM